MKKIEINNLELTNGGGNGWAYYAASCGIAVSLLESSFLAGPAVFTATAMFTSTCMLILPLYAASKK